VAVFVNSLCVLHTHADTTPGAQGARSRSTYWYCSLRFIHERRGETVWKVAVRVGSRVFWWRQAPNRCSFAPFRRPVGPRNGAYSEFPDSLWKEYSRKSAGPGPTPMGISARIRFTEIMS
jgi:hypothetical protein